MSSITQQLPCPQCRSLLRPSGLCPRCSLASLLQDSDEDEMLLEAEETPSRFGDYELLGEIARGGVGVVWRARQRGLGRTVALKILRETCLPGEESARRFRFEGETVARLRHPHIVAVHEIGETGGRWFMSMEMMEGGSLANRLAGRADQALPVRESVQLLVKVARAVQHAHDHGIIHRDLKPGNILLDAHGEPHVADFGLARSAEAMDFTLPGVIMGTPAYMSPEQATGLSHGLTTATDVYSLGAIFHEMLTGRVVFQGPSHADMLRQAREDEPVSPTRIVSSLDPDLGTICLKCLEKKPESRYASAGALADDLDRWLRGEPILARRSSALERLWKWARRHPARAALVVIAIAAVGAVGVGTVLYSLKVERERVAALHRVAMQHQERAVSLMENGDTYRGLLSLAESIDLGLGDAEADRMNRLRFASTLRHGPRLVGLWTAPAGETLRAQFSNNSAHVLVTHGFTASVDTEPLLTHSSEITGAEINDDATRVVCSTADGRWTLWNVATASVIATGQGSLRPFPKNNAGRPGGALAKDRFAIVDGSSVHQFKTEDGTMAYGDLVRDQPIQWAAYSPDAKKLIAFTADGRLHTAESVLPALISAGTPFPASVEFHSCMLFPTEAHVAVLDAASQSYGFLSYSYAIPDHPGVLHKPTWFPSVWTDLLAVGWAGTSSNFMTASPNGATRRSPWLLGKEASSYPQTTFHLGIEAVAGCYDDTSTNALTLTATGIGQRWDVNGERATGPLLWTQGTPLEAKLSHDGRSALLRTASAVWHWQWPAHDGARQAFTAEEWAAWPGKAAFLTGEDSVAGASVVSSFFVKLDNSTKPPLAHPRAVKALRFSPDGRLLCTLSGQGSVRIWDTVTSLPVTPPFDHPHATRAAWAADGQSLATFPATDSSDIRVWDLTPQTAPAAELKNLAKLLSSHALVPGKEAGLTVLTAAELQSAWAAAPTPTDVSPPEPHLPGGVEMTETIKLTQEGGGSQSNNFAGSGKAFANPNQPAPQLNDALVGEESTVLVPALGFASIILERPTVLDRVAFSRDRTGARQDQCRGTYTLQTLLEGDPSGAAKWTTIGTLTYRHAAPGFSPWLRHEFRFPPTLAKAFRIQIAPIAGDGLKLEELELYGPVGLTVSEGLTLESSGGGIAPNNLAPSGVAFAYDQIGYGTHSIAGVNDGGSGDSMSWIGSASSFIGVKFNDLKWLDRVAFSRDNTATAESDRSYGSYTVQTTADPDPADLEAKWKTIGIANYGNRVGDNYIPWQRHEYRFEPTLATGLRMLTNSFPGQEIAIDELELYGPEFIATTGEGGQATPNNLAPSGTAFAQDVIPGYPIHAISHLNDGQYGNDHSWVANSANSHAGIALGVAKAINRIAFGRDNHGVKQDRCSGTYTLQYTTDPDPSNPATTWTTLGTATYPTGSTNPSKPWARHEFRFAPVTATGIRVLTSSSGEGIGIDELEVYGP